MTFKHEMNKNTLSQFVLNNYVLLSQRHRQARIKASAPLINDFVDDSLRQRGPCVDQALLQFDHDSYRRFVNLLLNHALDGV